MAVDKQKKEPKKQPKKEQKKEQKKAKAKGKKSKKGKKSNLITVVKERPENTIDANYDKKVNVLLRRLKSENQFTDNTIRFGWK